MEKICRTWEGVQKSRFAVALLISLMIFSTSSLSDIADGSEGGYRSCFDDWECTEWGPCIDNFQTQECTFECTVEPCLEDSTLIRACDMPKLRVVTDKDEAKVGEVMQITVLDEDGRQVAAEIQITRPDGCMRVLVDNKYTVEQDGPLQITAQKTGYNGAQTQAVGRGSAESDSIFNNPMFYMLLLAALALLTYIIWKKTHEKDKPESL
jgi:hypothetical protein